ncbi:putative Protein kinase domain containing protein [Blattamonas nauphoetae]|uniref:Protein kinase domain-containing protein n=1 Tax=Blattamonas nauphoetae TaxID=2049346 RepID=A0ABQ9XC79_9EUKA|nr:putative Protein kinase domain containing protein [Blattamonas nauphoetae]
MELGSRNLKDLICEYEERGERIPLDVCFSRLPHFLFHSLLSLLCECNDAQVVVLICNDIVEGLKFMHTHPSGPTAHGDLKPENILLSVDNRAILCDLGAADEEGAMMSHSSREIGTYEYNAPERLDDEKMRGTPQSDMWSVGVILHRMVTGHPLFVGKTLPKLIGEITSFTGTEFASSIPPEIRDVLIRLLDPNPSLRLQSSQIVDGYLFKRMLGQTTPLLRLRNTVIQRQAQRIDDLTHFRFESEEEQWTFVSKSLHALATTRSTVTVSRWTKSSDDTALNYTDIEIHANSSRLIRDLPAQYDLGKHFLADRRLFDAGKTFAEEEITPSTNLGTFQHSHGINFLLRFRRELLSNQQAEPILSFFYRRSTDLIRADKPSLCSC